MSTLTKVFVVLLVVFSIAFTTMTISVVSQTADWRDTAQKFESHARVADTNLQNMIAANAAELTTAYDAVKSHLQTISELDGYVQASRNEVAQQRSELARAESERSSSEAIERGLIATLQSSNAARDEYRQQRNGLEKRNIELEGRNIDLNDRVNELTARTAVLMEQRRQFEQQVNILRSENENLAREARVRATGATMEDPASAAMKQVVALTPVSTTAVRGRVVDVSGNIITISVGAADGVKEGMIFVVHRGEQYLGDIKISLVDPNRSAGRPAGPHFVPKRGDQVTDALSLGSSRR